MCVPLPVLQVCAVTETEQAVSAIQSQAVDSGKALAMAELISTAVTILQKGGECVGEGWVLLLVCCSGYHEELWRKPPHCILV